MIPTDPNPAILPPHPLDAAGVVKIALGREATAALAACGPFHLALIAQADATAPPEIQGELILLCLPLDKATATAAARVAMGTHRAVRMKPTPQP